VIARGFQPSAWLRFIGTITFLGGGLAFLIEGWTDQSSVRRAVLWALATASLTVLGVLAQRRFRDPLGARVFLALAAGTVPLHFVLIGAALWHDGAVAAGVPDATSVALVVAPLLPVLAFGMSVLARHRSALLTLLLLALSAPLVVPTRGGDAIAALAAVEVVVLLVMELFAWRGDAAMQTREAVAARLLLLVPVAVLLGRSAYYPVTAAWLAALLAAPSAGLVAFPHVSSRHGRLAHFGQRLGAVGLLGATALVSPRAPVMGLLLSVCALGCSEALLDRPPTLQWLSALLFGATALDVVLDPGVSYLLLLLPLGTLHVLVAFRRRSADRLAFVLVATALGFVGQCVRLVRLPRHDLWIASVALGVVLLVLASLVESRKARLEQAWARVRSHFAEEAS
jgi:hypothetical protein